MSLEENYNRNYQDVGLLSAYAVITSILLNAFMPFQFTNRVPYHYQVPLFAFWSGISIFKSIWRQKRRFLVLAIEHFFILAGAVCGYFVNWYVSGHPVLL